jgi:chromosome segregation protein
MFVRSLRIAGFKSFADPIVLEFEPGINVIVGPNGSGKSNIADALGWALGSQAPTMLRGAAMEDVIFAGAQGRPRLGAAEVEVTLDNASRILPLDVAEVTIGRYADRSGASEYRINGAPCRLLDVTELLSDTGVGRSLHSLVGQGQLDAILGAHPEDRRAFVEEAAQVGKFRRRKERALRKIQRVDDNLTRLNDVVAELRRAVRPLQRQASVARAHSELLAEHRELRQRLAATEITVLSQEEAELAAPGDAQRAALLEDELGHTRARLRAAGGEREATAAAADRAGAVHHRLARACDRLAGLARVAREREDAVAARLQAETEEALRQRVALLEAEEERFRREARELASAATEAERAASVAASFAAARRGAVEEAETAVAAARARETEAAQALVRAEGMEVAGRASIGSLEARVAAVAERREVAGAALGEESGVISAAQAEVRALEERLDAAATLAAEAESTLEAERERAESLRARLGTSRARRAAARARVEAIEEIMALLADVPGVAGRVLPLLERARERGRAEAGSEAEAEAVVAEADARVEARWQDVARSDEELKRLDALASGAAERLAGARRRREGREIELAALDDELARAQETLAGAQRAAAEERAALPAHRAALDEARTARAAAEADVRRAQAAAEEAQGQLSAAVVGHRGVDERRLAAQLRLEEAEAGIADAQRGLAGLAERRDALRAARDSARVVAGVAGEAAGIALEWTTEAEGRAEDARRRARTADDQLTRLRRRERELEEQLEGVAARRARADVRRAEIRARAGALEERAMEEWGLSRDALSGIEPLEPAAEEDARARIEHLERDMRRLGPVNPRAAEEHEEMAGREAFLVEQMDDLRSSRRDLMRVVREVDDTVVDVFGRAFASVAGEFGTVFERVFPGGQGALRLTDAEDLLASGIDIEARPPGKSVRKLSLLSGGERSLVALAFLFSIFRSLPSPFYLLDEVDAALDDLNLQRFLTLAQELEARSQVMIVTHQKRTMEAADILYGVTMAKDGVSRVVAQRMNEALV